MYVFFVDSTFIGSCIAKTNSTTELNVQRDRTAYVPRESHTQRTLTKQQNVFEQKCIEIEKTSVVNNARKFTDESNLSIADGYRPCSSSTPIRLVQQIPPPPPTRSPHIVSNEKMNKIQKQLVDSLSRMNELEDRIRDIPRLQQELTTEKAENRDLHTKLKHMEQIVANMKREKLLSPVVQPPAPPPPPVKVEASTSPLKPFSPQRVCAMSLESLNFRFPNTSSPTNSVQSNPSLSLNNFSSASIASALHSLASGGHSQRNVACMTQSTLTRDIGIVTTTPEKKLTRSTATNTDVVHAPATLVHHVAVQCLIQEDTKKEYRNASTSTLPPAPLPPTPIPSAPIPVVTHSIGVMAVPKVRSTQCTARPDVKSIGTENIHQKIRTRNHGTDPIVELIEPTNSPRTESTAFASISLKSLDLLSSASVMPMIAAEKIAKVIQTASVGIQHVPNVLSTGSQCMERPTTSPPAPLPPKVCTDSASTDTCDLLLFRHRGVNTDEPAAKRDRPTNTEPIRTTDESTNTMATIAKSTTDIGTNPDQSAFGDDDALHQCHSCLAKIEIKQQTIISNKNTKLEQQHRMNASPAVPVVDDVQPKDAADASSRIPRPTALISPRPDRKFNRQNTYTVPSPVSLSPLHASPVAPPPAASVVQCPAEAYLR